MQKRKMISPCGPDFCSSDNPTVSALPKTTEAQVIGKQVLRSGTSVGANYREAYRGRSKAEFVSKCGDCLREIEETAYWLDRLAEADLVAPECLQPIREECGIDSDFRNNSGTLQRKPFLIFTFSFLIFTFPQ